MKIDSFTTARCNVCGWIKQFKPGVEYNGIDFNCKCEIETPKPKRGRADAVSDKLIKKNK